MFFTRDHCINPARLILLAVLIFIGMSTAAHALTGGQVSITMTTDPNMVADSNQCPSAGPLSAYVAFRIQNTSGASLTDLEATLSGFSSGFQLNPTQPATQFIGRLENNASRTVYWFIGYPCSDKKIPPTTTVTVSITDSVAGTVTHNEVLTSKMSLSANAGGHVNSTTLGPGAVVGQIFSYDVLYEFGNIAAGARLNLQPAGNASYNAGCFNLRDSEILHSGVPGITAGTTDTLSFVAPISDNPSDPTVSVRYFILYQCAGVNTSSFPYSSATSGTQDKYTDNFGDVSISFPVATNPFTISKTAANPLAPVGGTIRYTITINNTSGFDAFLDEISDTLPAGMSYAGLAAGSGVTDTNSGSLPSTGATGTLRFKGIPNTSHLVPAGGSLELIYDAVAPSTPGDYSNSATGISGQFTFGPASTSVKVLAQPTVTKSLSPAAIAPDDISRLILTLSNSNATDITGISLTDTLPAGMVVAPTPNATTTCGTGTVTAAAGTDTVTLDGAGALIPGTSSTGSCTVEVDVTASALGTYTNTINAGDLTTSYGGTNTAPASADLQVALLPTVSKAFAPSEILVGETSTVTLTITNPDVVPLTNLSLADNLPAGLEVAATPNAATTCGAGTVTAAAGGTTVSLGGGASIGADTTCAVIFDVTSSAGGSYTNTIEAGDLTCSEGKTNPAQASATLAVSDATLTVTKTADTTTVTNTPSGASATYTITVANSGTVAAKGVVLTDSLPAGFTFASTTAVTLNGVALTLPDDITRGGTDSVPTWDTNTGTGFTIDAGKTLVVQFDATVDASVADGTYHNSASATSSNAGSVTNFDGSDGAVSSDDVTVTSAVLTVTKSADAASIVNTASGSTASYTVTVTNSGTAAAQGVVLTDSLPAGFTFASTTAVTLNGAALTLPGDITRAGTDLAPTWNTSAGTGFTIDAGKTLVVQFDATVDASVADDTYNNSASAASTNAASVTDFNGSDGAVTSDDVTVTSAKLTVTKTTSTPTVSVSGTGATATYTITIENTGTEAATGVTVTDSLPVDFSYDSTTSVTLNGVAQAADSYTATTGQTPNWDTDPTGGFTINAGQTLHIVFDARIAAGAADGTYDNQVSITAPNAASVTDFDETTTTAENVTLSSGALISGTVYRDDNRNASFDGGEAGTGLDLSAKLIAASAPWGPAAKAVSVDPVTGEFSIPQVAAGDYTLIIDTTDNSSDISPSLPSGWLGTEEADRTMPLTVSGSDLSGLNFGLLPQPKIEGVVFIDNGQGGGTANNGIRDGSESGLPNVTIQLTDAGGGTLYAATTSDGGGSYSLPIPQGTSGTVWVREITPPGYVSVGGSPGTTAGTYSRVSDAVEFTLSAGLSYSGVDFGDVPQSALNTEGQKTALPGTAVFYPHSFIAGTEGTVSFSTSASASPAFAGWSEILYRDTNCNSLLEGGEPTLAGGTAVTAGETVCLLVKEFIPANAPHDARNKVTVTATFAYANASPALQGLYNRTDTTLVGASSSAGLTLVKRVNKPTASPGETLIYTIEFSNNSDGPLSNIRIHDMTPAFSLFDNATCPSPLPTALTGCSISSPAPGSSGSIDWTMSGELLPGARSEVTFQVTLE